MPSQRRARRFLALFPQESLEHRLAIRALQALAVVVNHHARVHPRLQRRPRDMLRDRVDLAPDRYMGTLLRVLPLMRYQRQHDLFELPFLGHRPNRLARSEVHRATLARRPRDLLLHLRQRLRHIHRRRPTRLPAGGALSNCAAMPAMRSVAVRIWSKPRASDRLRAACSASPRRSRSQSSADYSRSCASLLAIPLSASARSDRSSRLQCLRYHRTHQRRSASGRLFTRITSAHQTAPPAAVTARIPRSHRPTRAPFPPDKMRRCPRRSSLCGAHFRLRRIAASPSSAPPHTQQSLRVSPHPSNSKLAASASHRSPEHPPKEPPRERRRRLLQHQQSLHFALIVPIADRHDADGEMPPLVFQRKRRLRNTGPYARPAFSRSADRTAGSAQSFSRASPRTQPERPPQARDSADDSSPLRRQHHQGHRQRSHHFLVIPPLRLDQREQPGDFFSFPLLEVCALHAPSVRPRPRPNKVLID